MYVYWRGAHSGEIWSPRGTWGVCAGRPPVGICAAVDTDRMRSAVVLPSFLCIYWFVELFTYVVCAVCLLTPFLYGIVLAPPWRQRIYWKGLTADAADLGR